MPPCPKDISRSGLADYKMLYKAHLIIIDGIMMIAIERQEANAFFHFVKLGKSHSVFLLFLSLNLAISYPELRLEI